MGQSKGFIDKGICANINRVDSLDGVVRAGNISAVAIENKYT